MTGPFWRLPAEWESQSAVLIAWPHAGTDWAANLDDVESTYVALTHAIACFEGAIVVVADDRLRCINRRLRAARSRNLRCGRKDDCLR